MAFDISIYPWVYKAKYNPGGDWIEEYIEQPHDTPANEFSFDPEQKAALLAKRNFFPDLPLVNYTTQYGLGCFEGLKAYPQPDGSLKLFRPDENAKRLQRSMVGLKMPGFPTDMFLRGVRKILRRNQALGFAPSYQPSWRETDFSEASAIYIRPFTYSEAGIGLGLSLSPWVIMVAIPVGPYFQPGHNKITTTNKIRATPNGVGWIKCDANYVISILAKKEAESAGYFDTLFLDSIHGRYVEEGSACNVFFVMKNGDLVTPDLKDTILPGITRKSVLQLARDLGIAVEERPIDIEEVLNDVREAFVTGTAAGVHHIESITHQTQTVVFNQGNIGETTQQLQRLLRHIQYGLAADKHGWMIPIDNE